MREEEGGDACEGRPERRGGWSNNESSTCNNPYMCTQYTDIVCIALFCLSLFFFLFVFAGLLIRGDRLAVVGWAGGSQEGGEGEEVRRAKGICTLLT